MDCGDTAAAAAGEKKDPGAICTMHMGACDVCLREKAVTEPRDFGYPSIDKFPWGTHGTQN